jgi:transcriptional regulator with XRE-family HTH domain
MSQEREQAPAPPLGALLRRYRDARNWSQQRCADECGLDGSLISRLENGSREPTRETLAKLAAGLGLGLTERDALFVAAGFLPQGLAADDAGMALALAVWRALSDEGRDVAVREALTAIIRGALALAGGEG